MVRRTPPRGAYSIAPKSSRERVARSIGAGNTHDLVANERADKNLIAHLERNIETMSALLFEMHEAGVPLLLGTDLFGAVVPGFSVHQELELMVDAGLTPYEALRTGTVNVADYLDETDSAGTVEVGKRADFILVADNPLADIGNAADVSGVFFHGKWRSASDLANMLMEAKALSAGAE